MARIRYQNLYDRLKAITENKITFSLEALNNLVDGQLPNSAKVHPTAFFANSEGNSYSHSWMDAGFVARYDKENESVSFFRAESEEFKSRKKKISEPEEHYETLLVKNFSGSFNENGIGHEVINLFEANNNKKDFYIFYVPPYGSIGSFSEDFINTNAYRDIKKILVFDSTTITSILKLKAVILDPIPVDSIEEMKQIAASFKYGPNNIPLNKIDFNDNEFQKEKQKKTTLFPFTYKVKKAKYYNFEDDNLFVWHKRTGAMNNLKDKSLRTFHIVYGPKAKIEKLDDTTLGERNYSYKTLGQDLEDWFIKKVKPKLKKKKPWKLQAVPKVLKIEYKYSKNNFLEFVKKTTDENLYTNFICSILNSNEELKNSFFSFLIEKYLKKKNYKPRNLTVEPQCQSLIEPKRVANNYIRAESQKNKDKIRKELKDNWNFTDEQIDSLTQPFVDGQMDIYLHDENYRIAIENKILCGINGQHDDIDEDINQLKTYKLFLKELNDYGSDGKRKTNKVILLAPKNVANNFVNYDKDVPVMSYRDLAEFFTKKENKELIVEKYRDDFLNAVYKHSVTREEDVKTRLFEALKKDA